MLGSGGALTLRFGPMAAAAPTAGAAPAGGIPQIAPLAKYKLVFLGDQGAGKTSIITRLAQ